MQPGLQQPCPHWAIEKQDKLVHPYLIRHGIFVVTHHRDKRWQHPKTNKRMSFSALTGRATLCGDVIYDFNDQIVNPFHELHHNERRTTGNHGNTKQPLDRSLSTAMNPGIRSSTRSGSRRPLVPAVSC
jgi:hypothetical protein